MSTDHPPGRPSCKLDRLDHPPFSAPDSETASFLGSVRKARGATVASPVLPIGAVQAGPKNLNQMASKGSTERRVQV